MAWNGFYLWNDWIYIYSKAELIPNPALIQRSWFRFWIRGKNCGLESILIPNPVKAESNPDSESIPVESSTTLAVARDFWRILVKQWLAPWEDEPSALLTALSFVFYQMIVFRGHIGKKIYSNYPILPYAFLRVRISIAMTSPLTGEVSLLAIK